MEIMNSYGEVQIQDRQTMIGKKKEGKINK